MSTVRTTSDKIKPEHIKTVPLAVITKPAENTTPYIDRWWVATDDDEVLFFTRYNCRVGAPQCNRDKRMADGLIEKLYPDCKALFVPVAYVPIDWSEYH